MDSFPQDNQTLKKAIAAFNKHKTIEYRKKAYKAFKHGPLLVAVKEIPQSYFSKEKTSNGNYEVNMLAIKDEHGDFILAAFTDQNSVAKYEPGSPFLAMEPKSVLEIVERQYSGGIVINPAGPYLRIIQSQVREILNTWELL